MHARVTALNSNHNQQQLLPFQNVRKIPKCQLRDKTTAVSVCLNQIVSSWLKVKLNPPKLSTVSGNDDSELDSYFAKSQSFYGTS